MSRNQPESMEEAIESFKSCLSELLKQIDKGLRRSKLVLVMNKHVRRYKSERPKDNHQSKPGRKRKD